MKNAPNDIRIQTSTPFISQHYHFPVVLKRIILYILSIESIQYFKQLLENIRVETPWDRVALLRLLQVHCQCIVVHLVGHHTTKQNLQVKTPIGTK